MPNFRSIHTDQAIIRSWQAIFTQIKNPFEDHTYHDVTHQSKLTFRLSVPLIAKLFHLSITGIIFLQYIFGFLLFYISSSILKQITKDNFTTLIITLSIPFIYAGRVSFIDIRGVFDGIALFFLVVSMFKRNMIIITTAIIMTSFTDERGLIASSLVFVYWYIHESNEKRKLFTKYTSSVVLGGVIYLILRLFLSCFFHLSTQSGGIGFNVLASNLNLLPLGTWHGLEGNWMLVLIALFTLIFNKDKLTLLFFILSISIVLITGSLVADVTRSMAYVIPALFISILIIQKNDSLMFMRRLSVIVLLICFIYPAYNSGSNNIVEWNYPLPIRYAFNFFTDD